MSYLLLLLLLIPFAGAIFACALPTAAAKSWALLVSLLTLACFVVLLWHFDFQQVLSGFPFDQQAAKSVQIDFGGNTADNRFAVESIGFHLDLGVDSISILLVSLSVFLTPLAIAASFGSIKEREKEFYAWMLALLGAGIGVFIARDLLLFYIFFELTLIPMYFIIGIWGGAERRYAAIKYFLYIFAGSVLTLAAVIYLGSKYGTFDISTLTSFAQHGGNGALPLNCNERWLILLAFLAGFAVKVPLFPVHTWLPLAYTEAPTGGTVILAGALKLGTYGLLRIAIPIGMIDAGGVAFPAAARAVAVLCIIGILYCALCAWVQKDVKKLVAYSSVSHLGFCVLGLVALNAIGIQGSVLYMINHGISTGALFFCVGMIYERFHTRDIDQLSGLGRIMPKLAFFLVLFAMSSIGLPGTNGFVSEFLTVLGAFTSTVLGPAFASVAALGVILGAVYMLHMLARILFGPLKFPLAGAGEGQTASADGGHAEPQYSTQSNDIGFREIAILLPLAIAVLVLGVLPSSLLKPMLGPVELIRNPAALTVPAVLPH